MTELAAAVRSEPSMEDTLQRLQRVLAEEAGAAPAREAHEIPASMEQVTAEWLTAVLCPGASGASVESVQVVGGSDGSTSRRGLALSYNAAGLGAGLPTRIFGKSTPTLQNRLVCGLSGAIFNERDFYLHVRPALDIEAPRAFHAAADPESFRSIMLFPDMTVAGVVFTDPLTYINREQAEDMVRLMATYHAQTIGGSFRERMPLLKSSLQFQEDVNVAIDFETRSNIGIDRAERVIPQSIRSRKGEMWRDGLMGSLRKNVAGPVSLVHCDVHIGNWYRTAAGRMGLTDWQCVAYGNGAIDVAYALTSALTVEDRRAWERDLIAIYADQLARLGAQDDASFDTQWRRYREQLFHGFYNWVYTIGAGEMQPQMQPDEFSIINIERMAAAIDDHDALKLVAQ